MEIIIAGEHLKLSVPFDEQNMVRDIEHEIGALYDSWRRRFPQQTVEKLLAMMVYQYASRYHSGINETELLQKRLEKLKTLSASLVGNDKNTGTDDSLSDLTLLSDPESPF